MPLDELNEGTKPGQSSIFSPYEGSSDYDTSQYKEDLKKFRKMALESQVLTTTSECSAPTTENSLQQSSSSDGQQTTQEMEMGKLKKEIQVDESS